MESIVSYEEKGIRKDADNKENFEFLLKPILWRVLSATRSKVPGKTLVIKKSLDFCNGEIKLVT